MRNLYDTRGVTSFCAHLSSASKGIPQTFVSHLVRVLPLFAISRSGLPSNLHHSGADSWERILVTVPRQPPEIRTQVAKLLPRAFIFLEHRSCALCYGRKGNQGPRFFAIFMPAAIPLPSWRLQSSAAAAAHPEMPSYPLEEMTRANARAENSILEGIFLFV